MKKLIVTSVLTLLMNAVAVLSPLAAQAQCVMCKSQVEAARQERDDYNVSGLNTGILYMMTVPYLLIGAVGYFWYRRTHPRAAKA